MKMKIRTKVSCLLLALMVALTFAGCTDGGTSSQSEAPSQTQSLPSEQSVLPVSSEPEEPVSPYPLHPTKKEDEVSIQFCGDILLHYQPVQSALLADGSYDFSPYFSEVSKLLTADLKIVNLEGAVDDSRKPSSYPCFNYPSEIIRDAMGAGFNFFLTANNHSFDMRWSGLLATRAALQAAGAEFDGTYETKEQCDTPCVLNYGGIEIGIVTYSYGDNGMIVTIPEEHRPYAMREFNHDSTEDLDRLLDDVRKCREAGADFVILSLHWGAEYQDAPNATQKALAKALINTPDGPDIVLGNHAHAAQPTELHQVETLNGTANRLIVYSLGNFIADQSSVQVDKTRTSQMVSVTIRKTKDGVKIADAAYTPLMTYIREDTKTSDRYRVIPVGKYALAPTKPDIFINNADWEFCKRAWTRLQGVIGDSVPCLTGE